MTRVWDGSGESESEHARASGRLTATDQELLTSLSEKTDGRQQIILKSTDADEEIWMWVLRYSIAGPCLRLVRALVD